MKFLIDAQLPRRLAHHLRHAGYDTTHTLDLPDGNRTTDATILLVASREDRVIVTKDADFVNSFILNHQPKKLLLISTGNITNTKLEAIFLPNISIIINLLTTHDFIELTQTSLITHT